MSIIEFLWYALMIFLWVAYLFVLFFIFTDIFRDRSMNGFVKAIWILVCFFPLGALIYLIVRGRGMAERSQEAQQAALAAQQAYIREAAGTAGPADQIAQAKALLDNGAITQEEFDAIKNKALSA
ncbi:MAG: SHOCT domain-containing protein [Actinobacteria bacterium]|nr:SHOCT domain-containing protein [Actinomycetota bacterium]